MTYEELLTYEPFSVAQAEKERLIVDCLREKTKFHRERCASYRHMMDAIGYEEKSISAIQDIPFLPVRVFKELELSSVPDEDVFKTMTSSGTTGQRVSKIFLDRETASAQQKTLVRIVSDFTGSARLPMLIIDCPSVLKERAKFSARGAGILGFSIFARKKLYALDDNMDLQLDAVQEFLKEHEGEKVLVFGFTFMIWQHFYKKLKELKVHLPLENAILIHGGGWKKLVQEKVSSENFRKSLHEVCGIRQVCNYYGMVEQTGCIYMECEAGHLHASTYSDIIIRRAKDFSVCDIGEKGIIQVLSPMPKSYPGHLLLTEDEGVVLGVDDCNCGRKGKYFQVLGRLKQAEIRGCSDTYGDVG